MYSFYRADPGKTGYITIDDFIQIIQSRELSLPLDQQELLYLATEADIQSTGWVPIIQVASLLPGLLTTIFQQRMSLELVRQKLLIKSGKEYHSIATITATLWSVHRGAVVPTAVSI